MRLDGAIEDNRHTPLGESRPIDRLLSALRNAVGAAGVQARDSNTWRALCPAHVDAKPSLQITLKPDGQILLHCFGGCVFKDVLGALDMHPRDLYDPTTRRRAQGKRGSRRSSLADAVHYGYEDAQGALLFEVVRKPNKRFLMRRPARPDDTPGKVKRDADGSHWVWSLKLSPDYKKALDRVLYRLPEVNDAIRRNEVVFLSEGEKDADTLRGLGLVATTNPGGAEGWRTAYATYLQGADVVVLPDNDDAGIRRAVHVARDLLRVARSVRVLELPGLRQKGDVTDWIEAGHGRQELLTLAGTCLFADRWLEGNDGHRHGLQPKPCAAGSVSRRQQEVLAAFHALADAGEPATLRALCRSLLSARSTVQEHVARLIELGLVKRSKQKVRAAVVYEIASGAVETDPDTAVSDTDLSLSEVPDPTDVPGPEQSTDPAPLPQLVQSVSSDSAKCRSRMYTYGVGTLRKNYTDQSIQDSRVGAHARERHTDELRREERGLDQRSSGRRQRDPDPDANDRGRRSRNGVYPHFLRSEDPRSLHPPLQPLPQTSGGRVIQLEDDPHLWPEPFKEEWEERAAIMEFDGCLPRRVAEREAAFRVRVHASASPPPVSTDASPQEQPRKTSNQVEQGRVTNACR